VSTILITPGSISLTSPTITLTGEAAVNINAPVVTIGEVLMTPTLIAAAGVCPSFVPAPA
jgi:hypothetical protein